MDLDQFLTESRRRIYGFNYWIKYPGFSGLYLRYGKRYINEEIFYPVLDISNVTASRPGKGTFKNFISYLRKEHPELNIYVENVLIPRFGEGLLRMGFHRLDNSTIPEISSNYFMPAVGKLSIESGISI